MSFGGLFASYGRGRSIPAEDLHGKPLFSACSFFIFHLQNLLLQRGLNTNNDALFVNLSFYGQYCYYSVISVWLQQVS